MTQILEFELGSGCNLGEVHGECPNRHPNRYGDLDVSTPLTDEQIVATAVTAYRSLGFCGLVGWIYYNEPLLQEERMFRLMGRIKAEVPAARFILWTNGTLIPEDCAHYNRFEQIVVSNYGESSQRGIDRLLARKIDCRVIQNARLDDRLHQIQPIDDSRPCLRPFVEFIIDNYGNSHLCCYDWQGNATVGNINREDFATLAQRWRDMLPGIAGHAMNGKAPDFCRKCGHRWADNYQCHHELVVDRARRWRKQFEEVAT